MMRLLIGLAALLEAVSSLHPHAPLLWTSRPLPCTLRPCTQPRLCAAPEPEEPLSAPSPEEPVPPPETTTEALQRVFVSEFGAQTLALTVAFVAFIAWSTANLNDDFWLTPF